MERKGLTKGIFVVGLIVAILIVSAILAGVSTQLAMGSQGLNKDKYDAGPQEAQGPCGQGLPSLRGPYLLGYDSGWININDKAGQYFTVTHNLHSSDVIVDITGKMQANSGAHQRYFGLTGYISGWNKTYGGTGNENAFCVIQTSDGGYAISGNTNSSGAGGYDGLLVKTDSYGIVQWNKTYGGANSDVLSSIIQTSDGGYVMAGNTFSLGAGSNDAWLVKTDSSGTAQWNKTYGGAAGEAAYLIVQTSDGGYAMAGTTFSYGAGSSDFWLIKTDSSGNAQWNKTYGGATADSAFSVIQTSDGGYIVGGAETSFGAGKDDFWLLKTDSSGNVQWNQTYGGTGTDICRSVIRTRDGGYAMIGFTNSFGAGGYDLWLVKTDSLGTMQWNKTYGGTGNEQFGFSAIVQTIDGGYAIAGQTASFGAGGNDYWLIKTDAYGNMQWNKPYGGASTENAMSIIQTTDGGYAIAGYTTSFGAGGNDFYLVKTGVEGESGLAWTDSTVNTVTLYRGANDVYWNYVRVRIWRIR